MMTLPLFNFISAKDYNGAFILGALAASLSASIAVFYSLIHKNKDELCKNKKQNLYCQINNQNILLTSLNIFFKTMIFTLFFTYILFILFGYGAGSLKKYYKPKMITILKGIINLLFLFLLYYLLHYLTAIIITKKVPHFKNVFHAVFFDLGIIN